MIHVEKLRQQLVKGRGVRVGETAVVSKRIHTFYPEHPGKVHIVINADAGKTFYHRSSEDEIIHIDVFHEVATCDVRKVSDHIRKHIVTSRFKDLADFIDIQTGSGGGRLTGDLSYGLEEKLLKDHKNHVHMAGFIPEEMLDAIFFLVEKVEEGLEEQGIELRKVEKICHEIGNTPVDMSPYSTHSDSKLGSSETSTQNEGTHKEAIEAIEHFASLQEIEDVLEALYKEQRWSHMSKLKKRVAVAEEVIDYFEQTNHVEKKNSRVRLTREGEVLYEYIKLHYKELESLLRKSIRKLPTQKNRWGRDVMPNLKSPAKPEWGHQFSKPHEPLEELEELDIPETVKRSLTRCYFGGHDFYLNPEDLVVVKRAPKADQDICLLIDASASMAGYRLRNAKFLAKHLILKTNRRVSVLTFREKEVKVFVPFTKSFDELERGLKGIGATGLTPLALALDQCINYMSSKSLKNPLMILITDGIPTIPLWSSDPVEDAVKAASNISRKRIDFCCIGLQPNKECLVEVAKAARGKLFIVEELQRDILVGITRNSGQIL